MNSIGAIELKSPGCCGLSQHRCVIVIALVEIFGSLCAIAGFSYAYSTFPNWKEYVPFETQFFADSVLLGLINTLLILSGFGFILSLILLDGVVHVKLGHIRFWMTSMFTYKIVSSILVVGMELAGCRAPRLNACVFISMFLGFIEMLYIYVFLKKEEHKRRIQNLRYQEFLITRGSTKTQVQDEQRQLNPDEAKPKLPNDTDDDAVEANQGLCSSTENLIQYSKNNHFTA